jgi:hypothetical protein
MIVANLQPILLCKLLVQIATGAVGAEPVVHGASLRMKACYCLQDVFKFRHVTRDWSRRLLLSVYSALRLLFVTQIQFSAATVGRSNQHALSVCNLEIDK